MPRAGIWVLDDTPAPPPMRYFTLATSEIPIAANNSLTEITRMSHGETSSVNYIGFVSVSFQKEGVSSCFYPISRAGVLLEPQH